MQHEKFFVQPIVQILGTIPGGPKEFLGVKQAIASWMQKEAPDVSPDFFNSGHNVLESDTARVESVALNLNSQISYIAADYSHACHQVKGRFWHTELGMAVLPENYILFGMRLVTRTHGDYPAHPVLTTPSIVRSIAKEFGLHTDYGTPMNGKPFFIESDVEGNDYAMRRAVSDLVALLENPKRTLPIYVMTAPSKREDALFSREDVEKLARATLGTAHVYHLGLLATHHFRSMIGTDLCVYNGAVRVYNPGLNRETSRFEDHPLASPETIQGRFKGSRGFLPFLVRHAYQDSVSNQQEKEEIFPHFAQVRSRYYELESKKAEKESCAAVHTAEQSAEQSSPSAQVESLATPVPIAELPPQEEVVPQIEVSASPVVAAPELKEISLEKTVERLIRDNDYLRRQLEEAKAKHHAHLMAERAAHSNQIAAKNDEVDDALGLAASEEKTRVAIEKKLALLEEQMVAGRVAQAVAIEAPALSKGLFPPLNLIGDWADAALAGRVVVSNRARKAARGQQTHRDLESIYKGLMLLGGEYLTMRRASGQDTDFLKRAFESSMQSSRFEQRLSINPDQAGRYGDTYFVTVNGRKHFLSDHLTKGNARDPQSIIRIYYAYDEENKVVVVGHLPTHLENSRT
jgi:hypothetical protein